MHIIKQVGVFSLAFMLTFLLLEGYMQLAEVEPVSVTDYDPKVGRITIPNRTFIYYNEKFYHRPLQSVWIPRPCLPKAPVGQ